MKTKSDVIVLFLGVLFLSQLVLSNPVMAGSTMISAAGDNCFVLKSDGTLWAWGANNKGQLGDGTTTSRPSPAQIGTDKDWVSIATGTYMGAYVFALKTDGTTWGWGNNEFSQLGDGTNKNKPSPARIGTVKEWLLIAPGNAHTLGLKSDGTIWAWGLNNTGQLGDGTTVDKPSPVQIGTDNDWVSFTKGTAHTIALKKNGTLWAWGANTYGQLGDGTTVNKNTPIQIGDKW